MSNHENKVEKIKQQIADLAKANPNHAEQFKHLFDDVCHIEKKLIYSKQIAAAFGRPDTPDNLIFIESRIQISRAYSHRAGEVLRDLITVLRRMHLDDYPPSRLDKLDELANHLLSPR